MIKQMTKALLLTMLVLSSLPLKAQTQLRMYYPVAFEGTLAENLISLFEEKIQQFMQLNPDIKVETVYTGSYKQTRDKVLSSINSNEPLHLSLLLASDVFYLLDLDLICPFNDLISTTDDIYWIESFYPALSAGTQKNNRQWAAPFQSAVGTLLYNKDMFRAAGLDPESPPENWQRMIEMAKSLTLPEQSQWGLMIPSTAYSSWMLAGFAGQNDQPLMNAAGNKAYFDQPKTIEALSF